MKEQKVSYRFPDGKTFVGFIKNGTPNGSGSMTFPNGDIYEGEWINGEMSGQGKYCAFDINADKFTSEYVGTFAKNKFDGEGKMTFANHDVYIGQWQNGMRTGNGAYWSADGSYYFGLWKFDKRLRGVLHLSNGDIYDGEFKNGKFDGLGKYHWKHDNSMFEGIFKEGRPFKGIKISSLHSISHYSKADS